MPKEASFGLLHDDDLLLGGYQKVISRFSTNATVTNGWWIGPEWYSNAVNPWPLTPANRLVASNLVFSNQARTNLIFTQQISYQLVSNLPSSVTEAYVMLDSIKLQDDSTNPSPDIVTGKQIGRASCRERVLRLV